jgi:arginyl-tRNA synthetase
MTPPGSKMWKIPDAKAYLEKQLRAVMDSLSGEQVPVSVDKPREATWGDFSTNIAMVAADPLGRKPGEIAQDVASHLKLDPDIVESVEVAGPGFINFRLSVTYLRAKLGQILIEDDSFGSSDEGGNQQVQVEFVSANPTGPLNIVSARAAAVGDVLIRLLKFRGYDARSEYYVNDSGNQVTLLGYSMLARIKELSGEPFDIPEQGYHGKYLIPLAEEAQRERMPRLKDLTEPEQAEELGHWTVERMVARQKEVLQSYRVCFDKWFWESHLYEVHETEQVLGELNQKGVSYLEDGATFLATSRFGDSQDRIIVTSDGRYTYFLPDIAYHKNKRERGFVRVIDILGPDHHTFPGRMSAAMQALGYDKDFLHVILLQQVNLIRQGEVVKMSKRSGEMVTMEELLDEVGVDAARFFFCQRRSSAHLDFDIDLALKRTEDNPVYYVQYAHARIASIFRKSPYIIGDDPALELLKEPEEIDLVKMLLEFPDVISVCVNNLEPHPLTGYLQEVAATYHRFYHNHRVISDDEKLSRMRLGLCRAAQIVLRNGLELLGIEAPESM